MSERIAVYGHDHYAYVSGQRVLVGVTRTLRPVAGEPHAAFQLRVDALAQGLAAQGGVLSLDEELRDGVLVQVYLRLQMAPVAAPSLPSPARRTRRREETNR